MYWVDSNIYKLLVTKSQAENGMGRDILYKGMKSKMDTITLESKLHNAMYHGLH